MNKPLAVTLLTTAALAMATPAAAAPPFDQVTGAGTVAYFDGTAHLTVSARVPIDGEPTDASGTVVLKVPGEPAAHGSVSCLTVNPGQERAGVVATLSNGTSLRIRINEASPGEKDRVEIQVTEDPEAECGGSNRAGSRILNGNFRIVDN